MKIDLSKYDERTRGQWTLIKTDIQVKRTPCVPQITVVTAGAFPAKIADVRGWGRLSQKGKQGLKELEANGELIADAPLLLDRVRELEAINRSLRDCLKYELKVVNRNLRDCLKFERERIGG